MTKLKAAVVASLAFTCAPVMALELPASGGWDVFPLNNKNGCGTTRRFSDTGNSEIAIIIFRGSLQMIVTNNGWSAVVGEEYSLSYLVNDKRFDGIVSKGRQNVDGRKGFISSFDLDFADVLAAGSNLKIYKGEALVANLPLVGSKAGIAAAKSFGTAAFAEADAKKREQANTVVADPFAPVPRTGPARAVLRGSKADWVTLDDYPPEARAAGEGASSPSPSPSARPAARKNVR